MCTVTQVGMPQPAVPSRSHIGHQEKAEVSSSPVTQNARNELKLALRPILAARADDVPL